MKSLKMKDGVTRRSFLAGSTAGGLLMGLGAVMPGVSLQAADAEEVSS